MAVFSTQSCLMIALKQQLGSQSMYLKTLLVPVKAHVSVMLKKKKKTLWAHDKSFQIFVIFSLSVNGKSS